MAKTNRQESYKTKKGESDAHKMRRVYKDTLDHLLELDEDEWEDIDLPVREERKNTNGKTRQRPS